MITLRQVGILPVDVDTHESNAAYAQCIGYDTCSDMELFGFGYCWSWSL